jgi:hypothetical protein
MADQAARADMETRRQRLAQTIPDTHRGKWELAEDLLVASRDNLRRFAAEGSGDEERGAGEMADALDQIIGLLNGPTLLGHRG